MEEKLAVGLKLSPESLSTIIAIQRRINDRLNESDTFTLEAGEKIFLKDFLGEIVLASVSKAMKMERIGNNFLNCYEVAAGK